jgi:hypothetical protein
MCCQCVANVLLTLSDNNTELQAQLGAERTLSHSLTRQMEEATSARAQQQQRCKDQVRDLNDQVQTLTLQLAAANVRAQQEIATCPSSSDETASFRRLCAKVIHIYIYHIYIYTEREREQE